MTRPPTTSGAPPSVGSTSPCATTGMTCQKPQPFAPSAVSSAVLLRNAAAAVAFARDVSGVRKPVPSPRALSTRRPASSTTVTVIGAPSALAFACAAFTADSAIASVRSIMAISCLLRRERVGEHHGAGVVDEADRELGRLDHHLAEVVDAATRPQRARIERGVERPRAPGRRRQGAGDEFVERPWRRGLVTDDFRVMHIGGDEDEVLYRVLAQVLEDRVALGHEPRAVERQPERRYARPRIARIGAARRNGQRDARDDDLPDGVGTGHAVEEPSLLRSAEHGLVAAVRIGVQAAILARVENEQLEQPTPANTPIESRRLARRGRDGPVVEQRLPADGHQRVVRTGKVVANLVIVPDRIDGRAAEQRLERRVLVLIAVARPILRE